MAPAAGPADELIRLLDESCTATLASLRRPNREQPALSSTECLSDIRNDVLAHLQSISKEVTAISLALRPPVSQDALKGTLDKLVGTVGKLVYATELLPRGGTLAKRINWTVQESLEAFQHFLSSISSTLAAPSASAKAARDDLLRSAKTVWTVVERAQGLPKDELEAERLGWKDVLGLLDDCLEEMKEMGEAEDVGGEVDDDEGEEEEEEDDFGSTPLTPAQRERITAAHLLLRLTRLLVNRLFTKTAPPSPSPAFTDSSFLASAHMLVSRVSELGDDLAAALEPPQDELKEAVEEVLVVGEELAKCVEEAIDERGSEELKKTEKEWLGVWRKQREIAKAKLDAI
ncbi:proteophosphoglycan 5 [Rhodotorula toruloides]|uniref:Proteophosphoglycan 5 n=1 Tax=Rhodotorula toruloides TaxID=5286 RepID=A0A511KLG7_RHOTO|nr:proteophosphoglycan 5 [Rhodotorula toruloides]